MLEELLEIERVPGSVDEPVRAPESASIEAPPGPAADRLARHELRRQIAVLEKRLGELFASAFPRSGIEWGVPAVGGPRVLGVEDLERVRDALHVRLRDAEAELARQGEIEEANRGLLESMIAEPERYRWVRVAAEDVGERPCQHWHSRPRWGILGMLLGWWRVKHSSGCPLATGLAAPPRGTSHNAAPETAAADRHHAASSGLPLPPARAAPCVLAWRRLRLAVSGTSS